MIVERYRIEVERRPLRELPPDSGRVRSQPRIELDGFMVGGINDLLRLTRTRHLDEGAAGAPFTPAPRVTVWDRIRNHAQTRIMLSHTGPRSWRARWKPPASAVWSIG